ncbi:eukaryotic translation initiation factor 4e transporter [Limosa lapponica baueri]|uniref:Eukaryotic translation initiation factor 4e transporter n=1 Tax=Limosa lapponica baueri TaxID=1758121 RepID=A0A2I0T7K5_LIMLA|nr:eukaryotic translation initiation factor 4e transporter [Limosa lapponica baueri]
MMVSVLLVAVGLAVEELSLLREFGDSKRVFGERRRNDSYTEEEPEWFSAGPTSQSETIELTGFDDKILEEDHKGRKRTRRRTASLKEAHSGVVLSVEEVEAGLKGLKVDQEGKIATPFMAEQMEEALNVTGSRQIKKDGDMTAFNKLVSSMKASGTLPSQPKVNMSPLEIQQAALEGLALPHDLAIQAANFYQHGFGKPQMDKSRDGYRNRRVSDCKI